MNGHAVVLAVQDTIFFNFTHHPGTQGLGAIGAKGQNHANLGMHSALAVALRGQPLRLLTQEYLKRPLEEPSHTPQQARKQPIEEKESYRWLQALTKTGELVPAGVQVVTICDREADIYELDSLAQDRQAFLPGRSLVSGVIWSEGCLTQLLT